jgi:hypothetical protein
MRSRPEIEITVPSSVAPGATLDVELTVTGRSVTPVDFIAVEFHVWQGLRSPGDVAAVDQHELHQATVNVVNRTELRMEAYRYRASFEVPSDLPPTSPGDGIELHAWVDVHVAIPWWPDVRERHDVTILPVPIPIGASPWHAIWEDAGAAAGLVLDPAKRLLTGQISGCGVDVTVGQNASRPSSLVAHLRWKSWGLGLSIVGEGRSTRASNFPVEAFKRRFHVDGRDLEQARPALVGSLRVALLVFDEVTFGDDEAEVRSEAPGHDQPWIGTFLEDVVDLARAIETASGLIAPPAAMALFVPAWLRFANECEAALTVGSMAIRGGKFERAGFEIRTEFEGKSPAATTIQLVIDPPIGAVVDLASPGSLQRLPASIRGILISIGALGRPWLGADPEQAPSLQVLSASISQRFPVVIPDPAALRELMTALLALAAALRGDRHTGPYR